MWQRFVAGIHRSWLAVIDHPRLRPLWFAVYALTMYGGTVAAFNPPRSIVGEAGAISAHLIGALMMTGGLIAGFAVWTRWWKLERLGIGFAVLGVGMYALILFGIDLSSEAGTRQLQISVVLIATLLYFIRWVGIRGWEYEPPRRE